MVIGEYYCQLIGVDVENYFFFGSGLVDKSVNEYLVGWQVLNVSFYLEFDLFCIWIGDCLE